MSFCPIDDIHSVYLDNELPEKFKAEYEEHIKNCPQCQKKLAELKSLHNLFNIDSCSITPDSHYLDESFERLKIKMSYKKNVVQERKQIPFRSIGYYAVAAAAIFAFAFIIPVRLSSNKVSNANNNNYSTPYINSANNVSFDSGRSVVISGNIGDAVLTSVNNSSRDESFSGEYRQMGPHKQDMIKSVEVLRPNFTEDKTISIKVTFPGMYDGPISPEMIVPEIVITGSFE